MIWGIARGVSVHTIIYPLEVVKIRQQCSPRPEWSYRIAMDIFKSEGVGSFYKGLAPQLLKTGLKSAWCWPMITEFPPFLNDFGIKGFYQQAITGLAIATIDAGVTTPLEKAKVASAFSGKSTFSVKAIYTNGWTGLSTYWLRQSVSWTVFLVSQKVFREQCEAKQGSTLTLAQLAGVGVQTAFVVSLASAPFDVVNNLKLARSDSHSLELSWKSIRGLYRGWPLSALSLTVHNIASVIVIDALTSSRAG